MVSTTCKSRFPSQTGSGRSNFFFDVLPLGQGQRPSFSPSSYVRSSLQDAICGQPAPSHGKRSIVTKPENESEPAASRTTEQQQVGNHMRLGALLRLGLGIVDGRKGSTPVTWRSPGKGRHQAMRQQACISDPLPRKMQCPAGRPWLYAGVTARLGARGFLHFRLLSVVRDGSSSSRVVRRTCGR
jgi:hypothetical protein